MPCSRSRSAAIAARRYYHQYLQSVVAIFQIGEATFFQTTIEAIQDAESDVFLVGNAARSSAVSRARPTKRRK